MKPKQLGKYLTSGAFRDNTNLIYETLEKDPIFNNNKNWNDIASLSKSEYLELCWKQSQRFTEYAFPKFALAMVDHCVVSRLTNHFDVCLFTFFNIF